MVDWITILLTIFGLCRFEAVNSVDNAIINAGVLSTMNARYRRFFLVYGILFAVFVVRGMLPLLIVWSANPSIGPLGAFTGAFSNDPSVLAAVEQSAPVLLITGGTFLLFLFFHWWFLEPKSSFVSEKNYTRKVGFWFYAVASIILMILVWQAIQVNPLMALGAVAGSTIFFITDGFKQNAKESERELRKGNLPDLSKLLYLEVIDATFSIDGVLGAFAFTLSVPLILIGNGLGALVVREMTVHNVDRIKRYCCLKNGAMYSIFFLGLIMVLNSFGAGIPSWASPLITFGLVGYFFHKSNQNLPQTKKKKPSIA